MTRYRFTAEDCDVSLPGNVRVMSPEKANALLEQWEKESEKCRIHRDEEGTYWNPQPIGKG